MHSTFQSQQSQNLGHAGQAPWQETSLAPSKRAQLLVSKLTLTEKIGLLDADLRPTGGVPRLGIPAFEGWNGTPVLDLRVFVMVCTACMRET